LEKKDCKSHFRKVGLQYNTQGKKAC